MVIENYRDFMKMKTIGVLGGMGPRATADFNQRIVSICQEKYNAIHDTDFPPIIIYDVPISGFDEKGIENNRKVLSALKKGVQTLEKDNVDFIVIDCNTVHHYIDELRELTNKPIISIIKEVQKVVKKNKYTVVGILGSKTTVDKNIYRKVLTSSKVIYPKNSQENTITAIIRHVMGGTNNNKDVLQLNKIISSMKSNGAQAINCWVYRAFNSS